MSPTLSRRLSVLASPWRRTLLALLAVALCARLGVWQWHKGVHAQADWTRFERGTQRLQELNGRALAELPLFQRVRVGGELDGAHQFLLDNRSYRGRPGYEVLTPLLRDKAPTLLVDRGWVPFTGSRARLPDVTVRAPARVTLAGRLANLPSPGLASGRMAPDAHAPWPKVTSFPSMDQLAAALGRELAPRILLLDPGETLGYVREWQPPGMSPLRHYSYAIQWWCFAALALVLWALVGGRRAGRAASP
jgi:surfeit locus 1 family protein